MNHRLLSALLSFAASTSVACAHTFPSDDEHLTAARRSVEERTRFDLGCDDPAIARLGDVTRLGQQATRTNIGATCGEMRASYVVTCISNWGKITCSAEANTKTKESSQ